MEGSTGTRQYLTQPTTRVPINEFKFQWRLLNQARAAHVVSSIGRKTMNLIFHVKMTGSISSLSHVFQDDWFQFLEFQRMIGSISSIFQYDWQRPDDGGFSVLAITAEWSLHPDWQQPGDVVPPPWLSQLNGVSTQTGSTQVMWFLRSDHHSWMVSPPRRVTPRWCGSSALTVTAEWRLNPAWQHPGYGVPPLWPSQMNGLPT